MNLPVRKCYYVAKVSFCFMLVVLILSLFEQWRGKQRTVGAQVANLDDDFEREIREDEGKIIPGLGEGGDAAHLFGEAKRLGEESEKKLAINVYLSDRIAYNRTLKDHRNPACKRVLYDAELPSASVIIIFHNEPYSVVVRTIWSVVNSARRDQKWFARANYVERGTGRNMVLGYPGQDPSSPFVYLKEIILVDDNSTLPELKGKLSHYIQTRLPPDLIKILRLPDRVGLTRARLAGARYANGQVLVFLDAHCESQADWLRPLLQRVKDAPHAVVVPIIDVIEASSFYYSVQDAVTFQVGGFTFMGHFTWIDVPEREKKRRGSDIAPTWSPTMAGGLFAINRQYYWELGAYDEQMAGWGGENLEMSFRIWQCGGTLETVPCSRVGHVFRSFHPYGLPAHSDTHGINTARMAEVWMDEYAELFYLHRPDLRKNPKIGDVTHRKILREKLKCKSFQWYLDHVYTDKFVPVRDVYGFGRIQNPSTGLCLDSLQREGEAAPLGVYPCHKGLEATQYFALSLKGELRDEEKCAELQYTRSPSARDNSRRVLMVTCHGKLRGQRWRYLPSKQLQHIESSLCLSTPFSGSDVTARACGADPRQVWNIDYTEDNGFRIHKEGEPSEQELRLQKLRGQRRISRSLMSYNETEQTDTRRHHKRGKKKGRKGKKGKKAKKDKFILKLVRQVNNATEHLEADVYCRHRRLLPNDSFVRDIVAVLNDRDIKVINNGRVFEKHKVTDLHHRHKMVLPLAENVPKKEPPIKKRKERRKPEVQPVNVETRDNAPDTLDPIDTIGTLDTTDTREPSVMRLNQDSGKKIIIEDFVEIRPKVTEAPKRKRKRLRNKTMPLIAEREEEGTKPISLEDSPLDAQALARTRDLDSEEARPIPSHRHAPHAHRHTHVHLDIDNNKIDDKVDDKVNKKVKHTYKVDTEYKPQIKDKVINFKKVFDQVQSKLNKNTYNLVSKVQSESDKVDESAKVDTYKVYKDDKVVYTDGSEKFSSDEREERRDREERFDVKEDSQHEEQGDTNPSSHYSRSQNAPHPHTPVQQSHPPHDTGHAPNPRGQDTEAGPVRVVLRSNLTFNLGDEFFNWRQAADDVANLLGELSIPTNTTKSVEIDSRPEKDTVVTGRGREESSSESSSEEE